MGVEFLASYTFGKSIDNGSGAGGGTGTNGVVNRMALADTSAILGNQLENRANRGVSDFDRTHRLVFSYLGSSAAGFYGRQPPWSTDPLRLAALGDSHGDVGAADRCR